MEGLVGLEKGQGLPSLRRPSLPGHEEAQAVDVVGGATGAGLLGGGRLQGHAKGGDLPAVLGGDVDDTELAARSGDEQALAREGAQGLPHRGAGDLVLGRRRDLVDGLPGSEVAGEDRGPQRLVDAPGLGRRREGEAHATYLAKICDSSAKALNSMALPAGSRKNIVHCSPACPSKRR